MHFYAATSYILYCVLTYCCVFTSLTQTAEVMYSNTYASKQKIQFIYS